MKPRVTLSLPNRDNATLFPALLALLLVLMAALQWALPAEVVLPDAAGRAVAPQMAERSIMRTFPDDVILRRALFAPGRGVTGKSAEDSGPLDGATPVGIVRGKGFARVILQQADGSAVTLSLGSAYHGWALTRISQDSAIYKRNGKTLMLPLGSRASLPKQFRSIEKIDER